MKALYLLFLSLQSSLAWVPQGQGSFSSSSTCVLRRHILVSITTRKSSSSRVHDLTLTARSGDAKEFPGVPSPSHLSQRRSFLLTFMAVTAVWSPMFLAPPAAPAATDPDDDLLTQFGLGLSSSPDPFSSPSSFQSSKWPDSPSPLPTNKRSARELTREEETADPPQPAAEAGSSDLQRALEQSAQKKQVDPRTHG